MIDSDPFVHPNITDDDIIWASARLGNPKPDFFGKKRDDPRQEVLKSIETIDIAACPGSGKTTLLVAKLAILAKKWPYRTRGICVLSHTNAARHEIEKRLGNTSIGHRLLSYPHFIGTIHGFVNEFLAIPWLRSLGYTIKIIDNDVVEKHRRYLIRTDRQYTALKYAIGKMEKFQNLVGQWVVSSSDFHVLKTNGNPVFKNPCLAASQLKKLVEVVICGGYFRHDEMFVWANDLIDKYPSLAEVIRQRFPLLYNDETQDNSETQSRILHRVFTEGDTPVIRQRFGDINQAIYNFVGDTGATTYDFPDEMNQKNLPNTHRFGQKIANLATPLGMIFYDMKGQSPKIPLESGESEGRHTIFVSEEKTISKVLDSYAELLIATFSKQELLKGTFTAVGLVHKDKGDDKKPRHVGHYWAIYDSEITRQNPKPQTFVQYIFVGQGIIGTGVEVYPAVEKIAEGILRLARMGEGGMVTPRRRYKNRYILDLLNEHTEIKEIYEEMLLAFAVKKMALTQKEWEELWREKVQMISETIAGVSLSNAEANYFLAWSGESEGLNLSASTNMKYNNIYHFSKDGKDVAIQVGSIHSIKGETHTATLVLETFWHKHNIEALLPWLNGRESGPGEVRIQQQIRLKTHYVAMTRPTHLICLAMKRSTLENEKGDLDQNIERLKEHGWYDVKLI